MSYFTGTSNIFRYINIKMYGKTIQVSKLYLKVKSDNNPHKLSCTQPIALGIWAYTDIQAHATKITDTEIHLITPYLKQVNKHNIYTYIPYPIQVI